MNLLAALCSGFPATSAVVAIAPSIQSIAVATFIGLSAIVLVVFAWVVRSTRRPGEHDSARAYRLRSVLFAVAGGGLALLLAVTLAHTPYARADSPPDRIVHVTALQFGFRFSELPVLAVEDFESVAVIEELRLPSGVPIEFRVTSLDVNHGFAIYSPGGVIVAQTQAMPGYVNRPQTRLTEPGEYRVLCLEYCGNSHHFMRSAFVVEQQVTGELRNAAQ